MNETLCISMRDIMKNIAVRTNVAQEAMNASLLASTSRSIPNFNMGRLGRNKSDYYSKIWQETQNTDRIGQL